MRGKGESLTVTNVAISQCPSGYMGTSFPHVLNQLVVLGEWERNIILPGERNQSREETSQ